MTEVTQEDIAAAKASDKRYALIDMSAIVAAELRDSKALHLFMAALRKEAEDAIFEFADANVANPQEIMPLQVRVKAIVFLNRTIEELMNSAANAADHVINESLDNYNG
jgi:hypothetical protein